MEKLRPWTVDGSITVSKKYWIDDGKAQVSYEAVMKVPKDGWLREDFENYNDRSVVSELPIAEFLPESGRISKQAYKDAIQQYIQTYSDKVEWIEERRINPAGYKQVLDGYLPEFHLVPAVRDVTEETKTSGASLLSRLLSVIINRIASQNPEFQRLQGAVQGIKKLIEGETPDNKLAEIKEFEEKLKRELGLWDVDLSIGVDAPDIEKVFQLGTNIIINDGIPTCVSEKGHGLQRCLIFALMRVWAAEARRTQSETTGEIRERSHIFAFEEPELFLHPQMCKATYESLKQLSKTDQIFICTHSPHFIDIEDYNYICIVSKPDLETGTKVQRVQKELFEGERKKQFNMTRFFNPDRNELFFARKVVLVEGPTEKVILALLARRLGYFDYSVSVIDCGGKPNLTVYMEILNAFQIPYLVIHDEDPIDPEIQPGGPNYDPEKFRFARRIFEENQRIKDKLNSSIGKVEMIKGQFEDLLVVSKTQVEKFGKPLAAVEKYSKEEEEISDDLKEFIKKVYQ